MKRNKQRSKLTANSACSGCGSHFQLKLNQNPEVVVSGAEVIHRIVNGIEWYKSAQP